MSTTNKIEKALRSGAKELDLSAGYQEDSEKLTELPESLKRMTQLQSLDLTNNLLTTLPDWLGELTQLKSLELSSNELMTLPDSLGNLSQLESLNLSFNRLTAVPSSIGELSHLRSLDLKSNGITSLPESLHQLTELIEMNVGGNALAELPIWLIEMSQLKSLSIWKTGVNPLPDWIGELRNLEALEVDGNGLSTLPKSFSNLNQLIRLDLGSPGMGNPLRQLPSCIRKMRDLEELNVWCCEIESLPDWISELRQLRRVILNENLLTHLPASFAQLEHLEVLHLTDNPLNPELTEASREGTEAIKRYLRELAKGARKRYEAKLLILGDGNEGKTCVSRAIRDLPFLPQVTTRGVDVEQWKFEHPDHASEPNKEITLNIWDFEGQEINHQTHQFFLTTQALYLLVFKCRDQFLMDRAEYWLDTIRARAPQARVAIVVTQCEERTPYVPQDKLQAQYGDLLTEGQWLFAVGCGDKSGIQVLQAYLKRTAADLEFMGREWPESYSRAEEAIKDEAKRGTPHLSRSRLYDVFRASSIDETIFKDLAGSMSTLGVMTQFPDCPDLSDFIVLQPQWLTKAISEVMEDKQLASDKGEIALQRMENIWELKGYSGLFPTFHDCMKEFELCYDLEDTSRSCLVPLRFGYERPEIPWSAGNGVKERRVEYKLNIRPPMGLMSRFIVKTHHMMATTVEHPKGVYWHNGVFLRTGAGPLASEALCEFDSDARKLRIQVRAAFPQNLLEQIHGYVKAVFSFFCGLEAQRSYGCIKVDERNGAEQKCIGVHSESRIYSAIRKQRVLDCEYEFHDVDPQSLIWGFSTFGEYVFAKVISIPELRNELDKRPEWAETLTQDVVKLLGWVEEHRGKVEQLVQDQTNLLPEFKQELELKLHEYLAYSSEMLDDRELTAAPGLISIGTKERSKWNPASYFKKTYILTPFCENEANIHPCEDGHVEFTKDRDWWEKTAPWIARGTKLLSAGLQLAFAGMPLALAPKVFEAIKDDVKFMGELTKHLELEADNDTTPGAAEIFQGEYDKDVRGSNTESRLMRVALARFLEETAPTNYRARQWGSLRRVRMSDNSYRWLCETCTNV